MARTREMGRRGGAVLRSAVPLLAAAVLVSCLALGPASGQTVYADPANGQVLASRLCVSCHDIERAPSASLRTDILTFRAIANQPGANAVQMAGRIIIPHPAMPNVALTAAEIRDIVAYIMSLKAN